jgi:hypothetical protein
MFGMIVKENKWNRCKVQQENVMEEIVQEVTINLQTKWRSLPTFMTAKRSMPHSFFLSNK